MSAIDLDDHREIIRDFDQFYQNYYRDEIALLAQRFPKDQRSLYIEYLDLYRYDKVLAQDWLEHPDRIRKYAEEALRTFKLPVDVDLADAHVRLIDTESGDGSIPRYGVGELRSKHGGRYVAVRGQLAAVTGVKDRIVTAAFECQRCGVITDVEQESGHWAEPHECEGCERQGPFEINYKQSEFIDERKLQIKQFPSEAPAGEGEAMEAYARDDLPDVGGENGLADRAGDDVIIFGVVRREQVTHGRQKQPVFDQYLEARAIHFENSDLEEIDPEEHMDEIQRLASADDAIERFAHSIAPEIEPNRVWDIAFRLGTAYLFAAPRIDPDDGPTYRGDIHVLLIGDPGVAKSVFLRQVAELSPDCEHRSATGLSSDVGLTAAAAKTDFGGEEWTLKPGILVRAGWHAIIDEIDKGPDELTRINDALEGQQLVTVDKAGISATLRSRTGLLASGNPKFGRFDPYEPIKEQIDIKPSLFSRFDGIVPIFDKQDKDMDEKVARHVLDSYSEAAAMEKAQTNGHDVEREATARQVPKDVARAWIKHARENYDPTLPDDVKDELVEFYVDARDVNNSGDDQDAEVPGTTARKLETGIRYAAAFARLRLSDTIEQQDAEAAIDLSKKQMGLTTRDGEFDPDMFTEAAERTQKKRIRFIHSLVDDLAGRNGGASIEDLKTTAQEQRGYDESKVESTIEKLKDQGDIYELDADEYRTV